MMNKTKKLFLNRMQSLFFVIIFLLSSLQVSMMPVEAAMNFTVVPYQPNTDTRMQLAWSSVANAQVYEIFRDGIAIYEADVNQVLNYLSYTDTGLTPETLYAYEIRVYSDVAKLQRINITGDQVHASTSSMIPPSLARVQYDINSYDGLTGNGTLIVSWQNNSEACTGSVVRNATTLETWNINDVSQTLTIHNYPIVFNNQLLEFEVSSIDGDGNSSTYSVRASVIPVVPPVVSSAIHNGKVTLSWGAYTQIASFSIYRSKFINAAWGAWELVNTVLTPNMQSAEDTPIAGIYRYRLTAKESSTYKGHSNMTDALYRPGAPTNLTAQIVNASQIDLAWIADPGNESSLIVQRRAGSGSYVNIATLTPNQNTYSDSFTLVSGTTYYYRIAAHATDTNQMYSNESTISALLPQVPTLNSVLVNSDTAIVIHWTDQSNNETGFRIERKASTEANFAEIATRNANETSFTDTVEVGKTYYYRVCAYNNTGNSPYSGQITAGSSFVMIPAALQATAASYQQINLQWTYPLGSSYTTSIERKTGQESTWTVVGTTYSGAVSYSDTLGLLPGTVYYYRLRTVSGVVYSLYSNEANVITTSVILPVGLEAKAISDSRIQLSWSYSNAASYTVLVERKTGSTGIWAMIANIPSGVSSYTDTGLSPNNTYFYRVRTVIGSANSAYYPSVEGKAAVTMLGELSLLGNVVKDNRIYLSWSGGSGLIEYIVERKIKEGAYVLVAALPMGTVFWHDINIIPNATYSYRIKASGAGNQSPYSNEVTIINTYLEAPISLRATDTLEGAIQLEWKDQSLIESGFEITRWTYGVENSTKTFFVEQNTQSYIDTDVSIGSQYYYTVKAFASINHAYSLPTNQITAGVGIISPPEELNYLYSSSTRVLLKWKDSSTNEINFKVEKRKESEMQWSEVATVPANTQQYLASGLSDKEKYIFRVKACSSMGMDSYSNEIKVFTHKPKKPEDLQIEGLSSSQIILTWTDPLSGLQGFKIYRKKQGERIFQRVCELEPNTKSYIDQGLAPNMKYEYKVIAFNKNGIAPSSIVAGNTKEETTFTDIQNEDVAWAEEAIQALAERGVIVGVGDGSFRPLEDITRAEYISLLVRAFDFHATVVGTYADVKPQAWYYNEVVIAVRLGLVSADGSNKLYPEQLLQREDAAVMAVKAMDLAKKSLYRHGNDVLNGFKDKDEITPSAISSVATLYGEGLLKASIKTGIRPKGAMTRAEVAVLVYDLVQLLE